MSKQSRRDSEATVIKSLLNTALKAADSGIKLDSLTTFNGAQSGLDVAAVIWMIKEINSYTGLLTSRQCTNIKAWKTVLIDGEFDVYFRMLARGRSTPGFDLKGYVTFPKTSECLWTLEDWADGTTGFVNGRVTKSGGTFKCARVATQSDEPLPINPAPAYYDDEQVPV